MIMATSTPETSDEVKHVAQTFYNQGYNHGYSNGIFTGILGSVLVAVVTSIILKERHSSNFQLLRA